MILKSKGDAIMADGNLDEKLGEADQEQDEFGFNAASARKIRLLLSLQSEAAHAEALRLLRNLQDALIPKGR
jgi:hypothetical protein